MTGDSLRRRLVFSVKNFLTLKLGWPSDALDMALPVILAVGVTGASSAGDMPIVATAPILIFCAVCLLVSFRRRGALERKAEALCDLPISGSTTLAQSLAELDIKLAAVRNRLTQTHPVTKWQTREHLRDAIIADLERPSCSPLLGLIRFKDFDRLAAFDYDAANGALRAFADRLQRAIKPCHCTGQVDRDCFGIWFRDNPDLETAAAEFLAIIYVARQELSCGEQVIKPTLETARVSAPRDGATAEDLLLRGTAVLTGLTVNLGGEAVVQVTDTKDAAREQFTLEQDLARAIQQDELTMVFQPVVDTKAGRVVGAEALLRWDHPAFGPISPARFIPIVETVGLSDQFGIWVLNAACREARMWRDEGLDTLKVAVNLSARQLHEPGLKTKIQRTLARHDLDAEVLELELTETAAMADAQRTTHLFKELSAFGVNLSIDDFGTGYSSLSYLKNLPFDKLKIDREFVTDVDRRRDSRAICRALIELANGLDLLVLAEGVETDAEVRALQELGCHLFQGYVFSKPLSGPDFRKFCHAGDQRASAHKSVSIIHPPIERRSA